MNKKQKSGKMEEMNWKTILKIIVAILTAILGTLGAESCMGIL